MADKTDPNPATNGPDSSRPKSPEVTQEEITEAKHELREAIHSSHQMLAQAKNCFFL